MIPCSGILTLLTDFGMQEPFVGVMKGVVLARFPGARIASVRPIAMPAEPASQKEAGEPEVFKEDGTN